MIIYVDFSVNKHMWGILSVWGIKTYYLTYKINILLR